MASLCLTITHVSDDPDDFRVRLQYRTPDREIVRHGTTTGWQVGRVYLEALGYAFLRSEGLAESRLPFTLYRPGVGRPVRCSLHMDLEWVYLVIGAVGPPRAGICKIGTDWFVQDGGGGGFERIHLVCDVSAARSFGGALLTELGCPLDG
jgi:hypothetical protein